MIREMLELTDWCERAGDEPEHTGMARQLTITRLAATLNPDYRWQVQICHGPVAYGSHMSMRHFAREPTVITGNGDTIEAALADCVRWLQIHRKYLRRTVRP